MMKCLIIDDDEMIIATLEHYISQTEGMELVKSFTSSIEGANFYKQNNDIDLILLDVEMPDMTGLDFLSVMNSKTNVVLVTSKPEYAVKAFEYEVKDYILKPVQYSRFLKTRNNNNINIEVAAPPIPVRKVTMSVGTVPAGVYFK